MGHWLSRQMGRWVGSGERDVKIVTRNNTPYTQNNAEEDQTPARDKRRWEKIQISDP